MCNVWKSDRLIASIILQESLGKLVSEIMGWPSVRIAQDDLIWKPPCVDTNALNNSSNNSVVGFHQDSAYISNQFEPQDNNSVTVWMALDDADEETGCVQYVPGSHLWVSRV
jgi:ectoine hydroxylase-related dioxygenase (phytanoyl-CoA dioxygenase family)